MSVFLHKILVVLLQLLKQAAGHANYACLPGLLCSPSSNRMTHEKHSYGHAAAWAITLFLNSGFRIEPNLTASYQTPLSKDIEMIGLDDRKVFETFDVHSFCFQNLLSSPRTISRSPARAS